MSLLPPEPVVPDQQRARAPFPLRYDDIAQTGHMLVTAIPVALGDSGWKIVSKYISDDTFRRTRILPILSRFVIEAGSAPLSVASRIESESAIQLAHTLGPDGQVERLVLNMWCSIVGEAGRTHGPRPPNAGQLILGGRVFAEHVMTRPFDPPESRRVVELDMPGLPRIPPDRHDWQPPETLMQLPEKASWLDDSFAFDAAPIVFGSDRTDSNYHVNSLVYLRLFIDAALRRLWEHGKRAPLRADALEIAYRKPSFAGERVHVALRAFTCGERVGASLLLVSDKDAAGAIEAARPRCFARVWFVGE